MMRLQRAGGRPARRRLPALLAVGVLVLAGCGDDSDSSDSASTKDTEMSDMDMGEGSPSGEDAAKADRTIEVHTLDGERFQPDTIAVKMGETITFKVVNDDDIFHEFMLGDEKAQAEHDKEMAEMGDEPMDMDDEEHAVVVEAGETKELTWTFDEEGTVIYGCHQPGHYAAGMKGTITVS